MQTAIETTEWETTLRLISSERLAIQQRVKLGILDLQKARVEKFDEKGLRAYFAGITERGKKRLTVE